MKVPQAFWQGVEQFNQGQFYACHDTLEALWIEAAAPLKDFYQGILQIAVACYHLENHNWQGSVILLGEGIARLRRYLPVYASIDVAQLVSQSAKLLSDLQQAGPDRVVEFVRRLEADTAKGNNLSRIDQSHGAEANVASSINQRPLLKVLALETSQDQ